MTYSLEIKNIFLAKYLNKQIINKWILKYYEITKSNIENNIL